MLSILKKIEIKSQIGSEAFYSAVKQHKEAVKYAQNGLLVCYVFSTPYSNEYPSSCGLPTLDEVLINLSKGQEIYGVYVNSSEFVSDYENSGGSWCYDSYQDYITRKTALNY